MGNTNAIATMVGEAICKACRELEYSIRPHGRAKDKTADYANLRGNTERTAARLLELAALLPADTGDDTATAGATGTDGPTQAPKRRAKRRAAGE